MKKRGIVLALLMGIMLVLGLTSGLVYGQTPTPAASPTPTPTPMPAPVLTSIGWNDVDENNDINRGDILTFKFSVAMDTTVITYTNIDDMLPNSYRHTYGTVGLIAGWTEGDKWFVVTLGENETIDGGETVNPVDAVINAEGLADATVAPGPSIPQPESSSQWQWWYTLLILIVVVVLFAAMFMIRSKKGKG